MGRRKPIKRVLRPGVVYLADRRIDAILVYRTIPSRQKSRCNINDNTRWFEFRATPVVTTMMVSKQETMFGKDYVKVLISNSDQEFALGYVLVDEFLKCVRGKPTWDAVMEE